jgi:hypothetical protein
MMIFPGERFCWSPFSPKMISLGSWNANKNHIAHGRHRGGIRRYGRAAFGEIRSRARIEIVNAQAMGEHQSVGERAAHDSQTYISKFH